jgi:siroheme synthase-like protein
MEVNNNLEKNRLYPVFLKLENLRVLLVGAGNVGLEKLESILGNAPSVQVTVVAPFVRKELEQFLSEYPKCKIIKRHFEFADLDTADIVFCATDNPDLHALIKERARQMRLLVNVADTPPLCDFYLGSIVQKGNLKIAISTNGKSPTVAKRLKQVLNETIPDELENVLQNMQNIRNTISGGFTEKVRRLNELTEGLVAKKHSANLCKKGYERIRLLFNKR